MKRDVNWNGQPRGSGKSARAFLVMALLMPALGLVGIAAPGHAQAHAHPLLVEMATTQPGAKVSVIVQKATRSTSVEDEARGMGGSITADLNIINAFAADMTVEAVVRLSKNAGVRWISPDAPMKSTSCSGNPCVDTSRLAPVSYTRTTGADKLWNGDNGTTRLQGQGVTVAVIDSGIAPHNDLKQEYGGGGDVRLATSVRFNSSTSAWEDYFGHGTHVAGVIGGNGSQSEGIHTGMAPKVRLVNLKVGDDRGNVQMRDVVLALQWIYNNRTRYNIKVLNMSLSSTVFETHHTSPLNAAVEILWFSRVVVVVSAGNEGLGVNDGVLLAPANDPFVITVGATDSQGTAAPGDDIVAPWSSRGTTYIGPDKPDLVAPGKDIISLMPTTSGYLYQQHASHRQNGYTGSNDYFRMSGTSMSAPIVAGAVALLLQDEPNLNPDQVKYRLKATALRNEARWTGDTARWSGYNSSSAGAGMLDAHAAVTRNTTQSANSHIMVSSLLWTGPDPLQWQNVNWNNVNWNNVNWNNVNWNNVNWNNVNWNNSRWDD